MEFEGAGNGAAPNRAAGTVPTVEYIRGSDLGGGIGGILYTLRGGQPSFTWYNNRGDVVAKTGTDGTLTYQAAYEAFGSRTQEEGETEDSQRANTREETAWGGLYENMRWRDLETGTYLTRDPAGFVDGPNLYAYVRQNPWTKFDPLGLKTIEDYDNDIIALRKERDQKIADFEKQVEKWQKDGHSFYWPPSQVIGRIRDEYNRKIDGSQRQINRIFWATTFYNNWGNDADPFSVDDANPESLQVEGGLTAFQYYDRIQLVKDLSTLGVGAGVTAMAKRPRKRGGGRSVPINRTFNPSIEFTSNASGRTYRVFQRNDIDWDLVRSAGSRRGRGMTNAQAAEELGLPPQLTHQSGNNPATFATLHHSRKNANGPWFEASTRYHNIHNINKAPLHPGGNRPHPHQPMGRGPGSRRDHFQVGESPEYGHGAQ